LIFVNIHRFCPGGQIVQLARDHERGNGFSSVQHSYFFMAASHGKRRVRRP
jgi:hypothetical protein